jgi:hypothetical protein
MRPRVPILIRNPCYLLILCIICSCHKHNSSYNINELPPITAKGANTFGCLINGEVWVPFYNCGTIIPALAYNTPKLDLPYYSVYFEMQAYNSAYQIPGNDEWTVAPIDNTFYGVHGTGNYVDSLDIEFNGYGGVYTLFYLYHGPRNFTITTFDTVNHIIAGTFAFTLYYLPGNSTYVDSIAITEGRFDFQMTEAFSTCN